MRGIEGALSIWKELQQGGFASEVLRKKADSMKPEDLSLCSSLVYTALRKTTLWRDIYERFLKNKTSKFVGDAILIGTAGILGLKRFEAAPLVSAIVNEVRKFEPKSCGLVNAVLRRVEGEGRTIFERIKSSPRIEDKAMFSGVPKWVLPLWTKSWGNDGTSKLLEWAQIRPYSSLRLGDTKQASSIVKGLKEKGLNAWQSPIFSRSIRISSTVFPAGLEGYAQGVFSPQTESSMLVGSLAAKFYRGGHVLDMCAGRGVKAMQFLQETEETSIECWDLSESRTRAAERESKRLGLDGRAKFKAGDAMLLEPDKKPSLILLDAPCSGSGTWTRRPESKWRTNRGTLDSLTKTQSNLFSRALSLMDNGGVIIYSTCSLFREENEQVTSAGLSCGFQFLPANFKGEFIKRGAPFGFYVLPMLPWLDGFYYAVVKK